MLQSKKEISGNFAIFGVLIAIAFFCNSLSHRVDNYLVQTMFNAIYDIVFLGLLAYWCTSIKKRIINKQICKYLLIVGVLMIMWIMVRTCKWQLIDKTADLGRYLWYFFYVPMVFIPLFGVFIIVCVDKPDDYKVPWALKLLYIPAIMIVLLVFTNDYHRLMFDFPNGIVNYDTQYVYGVLYYVAPAWFLVLGFYFVIMLLVKSRAPGSKWFQNLPIVIMAVGLVFWTLYFIGAIEADLVAMDCLIISLLLESAIESGLIRSNTYYNELFNISTIAAQIVDNDYNQRYVSRRAIAISPQIMKRAEKQVVDLGDIQLYSRKVSGGYVLWQNNVKKNKTIMYRLREVQEQLNENNDLLKAELEIKERQARIEEKNRLYDRIAQDVAHQLDLVDSLINQAQGNDKASKNVLWKICVICAYIKRRSNLLLLNEESSQINSKELEYCIKESLDNLLLNSVVTALDCKCNDIVDIEDALAIYDFFEKVVELTLNRANAYLVHLNCSANQFSFNMQIGFDVDFDASELTSLDLKNATVICNVQEEDVYIKVHRKGGAEK